METMQRRAVTHADVPPALLSAMNTDEVPPSLETLVIGGEPVRHRSCGGGRGGSAW